MYGPIQSQLTPVVSLEPLPNDLDPVRLIDTLLHGNARSLPGNSIQTFDRDPLTSEEIFDLIGSEGDLRSGRFVEIAEDVSDDDLLRFLESD